MYIPITKSLQLLICTCLLSVLVWKNLSAQQQHPVTEKEQWVAEKAYIDGLAAFENENYQKALELLNTAYVKLPNHPAISYALADTYLHINDLDNAEYYGKQATKLDPHNHWYHLTLIHIYRIAGKTESAITELKTALDYNPTNKDLLYELAQIYSNQGKFERANKVYNKLLYLGGEDINLRLQKLQNFNKMGLQDSAIVELEKIRDRDPSNLSTLHVLGKYYLKMNKLEEARKVLKDALEIDEEDSQTLLMLSDIYIAQAKWDSLETTLGAVVADSTIALETKIETTEYLFSKFEQDRSNNQLRKAAAAIYQKLLETNRESGRAAALAADFFIQTGRREQALNALERTTILVPTNDSAWKKRLQLLLQTGKNKEAIEVGQKASQQIPQDPIILFLLGNAYLSEQQPANAIEKLTSASNLPARRPLKASIYGSLGDAYAALKDWGQAFTAYDKSLKFDGQRAIVLNNYAYYLSLQKKDLSKAQEMAQRALELEPNNSSYLDTMGWILYQQGDFNEAEKFIQKAIDAGPASADVLEHMGDVMSKLGKNQQARQWWKKAFEKDSSRTYLKNKF